MHENKYLALMPVLNRSYFREGVVKLLVNSIYRIHLPEVIARVSRRMSGVNNPFYGKTHSEEQRLTMSLGHTNRVHVYQYTLDYIFTGKEAHSMQKAVEIGAKYTGVDRVIANGAGE